MKRTNTEIEDILNSFDGIKRAEANPFLYTRVMARLQEENSFWTRTINFFTKPAVAFACLVIILATNFIAILKADEPKQETTIATTVTDVLQNNNYILASNDINQ